MKFTTCIVAISYKVLKIKHHEAHVAMTFIGVTAAVPSVNIN